MTQDDIQKEYIGVVKTLLAHPLTDCGSPDYQITQILKHADRIIEHATSIVTKDTLKDVVDSVFDERFGSMEGAVGEDYNLLLGEKAAIESALSKTRGNRRISAQMLGISERTLYRKIKEYNLE